MPREMLPTRTPCSPARLIVALARPWREALGQVTDAAPLRLLVAQWALETGRGQECRAWNLGNVKSVEGDEHDWCFFECGEVLGIEAAHRARDASPLASIRWENDHQAEVLFRPDHPACRFRAFAGLDEGAASWFALMRGRFASAWPELMAANPHLFASALHAAGYFTADPLQYGATLHRLYREFANLDPCGLHFDLDTIAGLQGALFSLGQYAGAIDGAAGPETTAAIREFQGRNGLVVDGIAGPRTRAAIAAELGRAPR